MYFNIYAIPVYVTLLFLFLIFVVSLRNRQSKHMYYFIMFNFASAVYTLFYALEISSSKVGFAEIFYKLEYLGIPYIIAFFLLFVLRYTGKTKFFSKNLAILIYIVPLLTSVSAFTNRWHHFHLSNFSLNYSGPFPVVEFSPSFGYWIAQVFYLIYMFASLFLLINHRKKASKNVRKQINILLLASIIPFFFWLLYLAGLIPYNLDPVPFAFLLSSVLVFFGLSKSTLLHSDYLLRNALFENIGSSVILTDSEDRISDFNMVAEKKLLMSNSMIGLHAEHELFFWHLLMSYDKNNTLTATDRKTGRTYKISMTGLNSITNEKIGNMFILSDITENIRTAEALQTSEESFKDIIDNATDMIQSIDKDGRFVFVNQAWKNLLGYNDNEIKQLRVWDIIDEGSIKHCKAVFSNVMNGECENNIETIFKTKDGRKIHVEGNINCRYEKDLLISTRGIFRDITERLTVQNNLNKQLKNQKMINDISSLFINSDSSNISASINNALELCLNAYEVDRVCLYRFDKNKTNVGTDTCVLRLKKFEPAQKTRNLEEWSFPWWKEQARKNNFVLVEDVNLLPAEAKNEKIVYISQGIKTLLSIPLISGRKVLGFIGLDNIEHLKHWEEDQVKTIQVITEIIAKSIFKTEAEESLRKSKEQFQLAVKGSNDGIWDWNVKSDFLYLSPRWKQMIGYEDHELPNTFNTFEENIHPDDKERVLNNLHDYVNGKINNYKTEFRFRHKNGNYLWMLTKGDGIHDADGKIIRMAGSHTDITKDYEEKQVVQKLLAETELLIKSSGNLLYDEIAQNIKEISGAEFSGLNIFDPETEGAVTVSFAGIPDRLKNGLEILGFDLKNKFWKKDPGIVEKMKNDTISIYEDLSEMTGNSITKTTIKILINRFNLGKVALVKIAKENVNIGYFTLIFSKNEEIKNRQLVELYSNYVGIYIDRNKSMQELVNSEIRYRELIENAGTAILVSRANKIIFANNYSLKMFGFSTEEFYKMHLGNLIVDDDYDFAVSKYKKIGIDKKPVTISPVRIIDNKSRLRWLELNAVIINWGNKEAVLSFATDITERINYEMELSSKQKLLSAIAESTDELLKNEDYLVALPKVFSCLGAATNVDRVYIFENNFDENDIPLRSCSQKMEWCNASVKPQINNPWLQDLPFRVIGELISDLEKHNVFNKNVKDLTISGTRKLLEAQDIVSLLILPLRVDGKFWGFLGFDDCKNERDWSGDEYSILQSFAGSLSYAIERKVLLSKLSESVTIAEKASKAKGEFLANMSHEIRTPLNGVIGFSDLLVRTDLKDSQLQYAKSINQSATALLDLINDILDFSKIEAGKLELNYEVIELHYIIGQITDIVKFAAHQKNLEILLNIKKDVPAFVYADYVRLRQILINLMSNAIKFTQAGEIEILVETSPTGNNNTTMLRFSIRDTGIGIASDLQNKIFESFTQADSTITKKYGGSGLGLTIVNRLLSLMGSKLMLKSEPGSGSTFWFDLELKIAENKTRSNFDINKLKILNKTLIVDDNKNNLRILSDMLNMFGIESIKTDNAATALKEIKRDIPSLAIIDYNMPEKDGLQLISEIRQTLKISAQKMPVIFLHSSSELDMIPDLLNSKEINLELIKPLKLSQLQSALFRICEEEFENTTEVITPKDKAGEKEEIQEQHISQTPKILIAEDNMTNMMLAKHILSAVIPEAEIIEATDGTEAVDLFEKHNPDLIFMDIHMPNMSGYDATKKIRSMKKGRNIPVIALTAGTLAEEKQKSIESGMNDYIPKPIVVATIQAIVEKYIKRT